jgi:predicted DCC family thiol-disulfide oxidoreductase YuxK
MREPMSELSVYRDGACPLCRAEIAHYRRCRGAEALSFVDVSTTAPSEGLSCRQALARFHVREAGGQLLSGAAACARLWRALPGWRWLGRLVAMSLVLPAAEAAYRAFLPVCPRLARLVHRIG